MPIVSGEGPRDDPIPHVAVRNSKLLMLSARFIEEGLIRPRPGAISERRDGGRGIAIVAEVGVGI